MLDAISRVTYDLVQGAGGYAPHAVCLLQDPGIIAIEVLANLAVAAAYFVIPAALWRFVRHQPLLPFRSVLVMFLVFILACGTSHLTRVATLFFGGWVYWLDAGVCVLTAVASLGTAILLARHGREIAGLAARRLVRAA